MDSKAIVIQSGVKKQIPDADTLLTGVGLKSVAASSLTLTGGTGTVVVAGTADIAIIDRAGTISIGATSGTSITIGRSGQLATVAGNLSVSGTETVVGTTTFQDSATFEGNVTFGNAVTDTLTFTSRISGNVHFLKETAHTLDIDASTTAVTAGGALTIKSGNGNGAAGGAFTIDSGTGTVGGALQFGNSNAASVGVGRSGITTTVTGGLTQLTGAFSLTGNADSSMTTSSGSITIIADTDIFFQTTTGSLSISSAAAATWSVSIGTLTIIGGSGGGILMETVATDSPITITTTIGNSAITIDSVNSLTLQADASSTWSTTGGATLSIDGDGGLTLFSTTGQARLAGVVSFSGTTGEAIDVGELVAIRDLAGTTEIMKADADSGTDTLRNVVGIANATVGAAASLDIIVSGERTVPNGEWDSAPVTSDVGKISYLSTTPGNWTLTAPATAGDTVIKAGILTMVDSKASTTRVNVQIGDRINL